MTSGMTSPTMSLVQKKKELPTVGYSSIGLSLKNLRPIRRIIEKEIHNSLYLENVESLSLKTSNGEEYVIDKEFVLTSKLELNELIRKLQYADAQSIKRGKKVIPQTEINLQ